MSVYFTEEALDLIDNWHNNFYVYSIKLNNKINIITTSDFSTLGGYSIKMLDKYYQTPLSPNVRISQFFSNVLSDMTIVTSDQKHAVAFSFKEQEKIDKGQVKGLSEKGLIFPFSGTSQEFKNLIANKYKTDNGAIIKCTSDSVYASNLMSLIV